MSAETKEPKVYISGALTEVSNPDLLKKFYEDIGAICREFGMNPYIPHQHTDPDSHPNIIPRQVFERDYEQVLNSDLIIAYVGMPSLGVGSEIMISAGEGNIPIILLREKGKKISRMARGNPAVIDEIAFTDYSDALSQLRRRLEKTFFELHFVKDAREIGSEQTILGVSAEAIRKRPSAEQKMYDRKVREIAEELQNEGWTVKANLPGYAPPRPIGKYKIVADIEATKGDANKLIEVATPSTLRLNKKLRDSLKKSAAQRKNTTFRTIMAI
jgi:hypothetical protein